MTTSSFFVDHAAPGSGPRLQDNAPPATLSELVEAFEATASVQNPDADVPVRALAMSEAGTIVVPDRGSFDLTPWSKKQLGARLGIVWNRWFDGISPSVRADEINRRLALDTGMLRVKTDSVRFKDGSDGTLRALVTPSYTTIPDATVAQMLLEELRAGDPAVRRVETTDRTTSYLVQVGDPLRLNGPAAVGDVRGGLVIRNSDVGYASLVVQLHLTRLVCLNGMVVAEDTTILHRAHRRLDLDALRMKLSAGLRDVPSRIQRAGRLLEQAGHHAVENVEAALVEVLRLARIPVRLLPVMLAAYEREPHASVHGITQAITLGAQDPKVGVEGRLALESAAGTYLARFAVR